MMSTTVGINFAVSLGRLRSQLEGNDENEVGTVDKLVGNLWYEADFFTTPCKEVAG